MWSRSAAFHPAALDRVPFPIVEGSDGRALGLELNHAVFLAVPLLVELHLRFNSSVKSAEVVHEI